jgi:hypothetical protein
MNHRCHRAIVDPFSPARDKPYCSGDSGLIAQGHDFTDLERQT